VGLFNGTLPVQSGAPIRLNVREVETAILLGGGLAWFLFPIYSCGVVYGGRVELMLSSSLK
jgi:hypothetical protein